MEIPIKTRVFSLILKGIVVLSAAVGVFLSAYASRNTFMGGSWVFMYFTIQSNIVVAVLSLIGAVLLLRPGRIPNAWYVLFPQLGQPGRRLRLYKGAAVHGLRMVDSRPAAFFDCGRIRLSSASWPHQEKDQFRQNGFLTLRTIPAGAASYDSRSVHKKGTFAFLNYITQKQAPQEAECLLPPSAGCFSHHTEYRNGGFAIPKEW